MRSAVVLVDVSDYRRSHGSNPRGRGAWAFSTVNPRGGADVLKHVLWVTDSYAVAKRDAIRNAAARGVSVLYVLA